jgi:hypothetical protein
MSETQEHRKTAFCGVHLADFSAITRSFEFTR